MDGSRRGITKGCDALTEIHDVDYASLKESILGLQTLSQSEQKELQVKKHPIELVNESFEMNPENIKPVLINVDSKSKEWKTWKSIEEHVASFEFRRSPGRNNYFIVRNEYDGKNLGVIDVAADFLSLGARDKHVGWDMDTRKIRNRNIANISICVPTRNFGFNLSGGKLLTMLAASEEVGNHWEDKYGDKLLGLTVTSLYGKSVQYNKLDYFKFLGKTKGQGTAQIPDEIYKECRKVVENFEGKILGGRFTTGKNSRINILRKACEHLDIDAKILTTHGLQRGIYWCDRYENTPEWLRGETTTLIERDNMDAESLADLWRTKWAYRRVANLKKRNEFGIIVS